MAPGSTQAWLQLGRLAQRLSALFDGLLALQAVAIAPATPLSLTL